MENMSLNPEAPSLECYLKTKLGKFKEHILEIKDCTMVLRPTKSRNIEARTLLQPLNKCHVRLAKSHNVDSNQKGSVTVYYPVQVDVSANKTRLLNFKSQEEQKHCL